MKRVEKKKLIFAGVFITMLIGCKDKIKFEDDPYLHPVITIENNKISAKYCDGFGSYITMDDGLIRISGGDSAYFFKYDGKNIELVKTTKGKTGRIFHDSILIYRSTDGNGIWKLSIYERDGDSWKFRQDIGSQRQGSSFGEDIDIDGDFMIIGDPGYFMSGPDEGLGYIYHRNDKGWILEQELYDEQQNSRRFGSLVKIYKNFLIEGRNQNDGINIYKYDQKWELLRTDNIYIGTMVHSRNCFMYYENSSQFRSFTLEPDGNFNYHPVICDFNCPSPSPSGEFIEIKDSLALLAMECSCYLLKFDSNQWSKENLFNSGLLSYTGLGITAKYLVLGMNGDSPESSYVYFINY